jgi:hypothetical protein
MNIGAIILDLGFNILELMLERVTMFLGFAKVVLDIFDAE